ncbi:acyl-CoA dehydratase activase [Clostridium sporogenes]|uniref:2-hydroxyglutaryl-CoA dehydratase n=1 Tax=Clostridium botulinum TaxID=1491 RepID=A0A6M0SU30_CLOBO|nr:2-hydroxyisocaproyl-CoA dehydratase activator HadI [Clostridium sporogenes]NFA59006.1 2-hydroxyglutaryl-CoA dehydratase [Clostridium botulinum]NFI72959.1 2-hydroxyglutaryl-CoA dehydratase [Clostridium sporogenes]NFL71390.1 2-hydroxyglutaryl-CoA dehydratase [Clostridium sporogenes]NFM23000.1 2-hydroxyglutaryl-CoA dehydratase [Clostridium sporogenes]NFP60372.1 2-hydroxyglutaryl-CoA dehydratase [Clostridium sporogenes]
MYTMGLDIGSTTSKGVIMKDGKEIVASVLVPVGTGTSGPLKLIKELKEKSNLTEKDIEKTVVTGYGRMQYKADKQISELSCHAKGVAFLIPSARTIIDIGGQDAKAMKLNDKGKLMNFIMNDKCAAGTGRFLDVMSGVLETDVSKLGEISEKSTKEVSISSTCTVFAESEVISHLSANAKKEDIVAGIHTSVVRRVSTLAMRVGIEDEVVMVGGVARNKGIVKAMEREIGHNIKVPELAQLTGALGAAIYAFEETK